MTELLKLIGLKKGGIWNITSKIAKIIAIMAVLQTLVEILVYFSISSIANSNIGLEEFKTLYIYHIYALIVSASIILVLNILKDYYIYKLDEFRAFKTVSKLAIFLLAVDFSTYIISLIGYLNFINAVKDVSGGSIQEFIANLSVRLSATNLNIDTMMFLISMLNIVTILSILYYLTRGLDARSIRITLIALFMLFILMPPGFLGSIARMVFYLLISYGFKEVGDRARNVYNLQKNPRMLLDEINERMINGNVYLRTLSIELQIPVGIIYYLVEKWIKSGEIDGILDGYVLIPNTLQ